MTMERQPSPLRMDPRKQEPFNRLDHPPHPVSTDIRSPTTSEAYAARQGQSAVRFKNPHPFSSEPLPAQTIPQYVSEAPYRERQPSVTRERFLSVQSFPEDSRRSSAISTFDIDGPRRHSDMISPGGLVSRLGDFNMSTPSTRQNSVASIPMNIVEAGRSQLLTGVKETELANLKLPHRRSQKSAWLIATSDALIAPIPLRRSKDPIDPVATANTQASTSSKWVHIRARVTPRDKEKKPFIIQRGFDVEAMRTSSHFPHDSRGRRNSIVCQELKCTIPGSGRRGRQESTEISESERDTTPSNTQAQKQRARSDSPPAQAERRRYSVSEKRLLPIHIDYTLQYLPILAAVSLSGHVKKGDVIELPVPHPLAWYETMRFIYTAEGLSEAVRENVEYFAGTV